jgi:hypothetical protein
MKKTMSKHSPGRILTDGEAQFAIAEHLNWLNGKLPSEKRREGKHSPSALQAWVAARGWTASMHYRSKKA